ncbi:MFS transporter [bacterium]|nr:MFS transporter [bacterium]
MNHRARTRPSLLLVALAYVGFVSLGLPDAVIGVAWPSVRDTFTLPQAAVGLVFVASGFGYFVTSFVSGRLSQHLGIGLLLAGSTGLVAAAMFGFAAAPLWALFVACAVAHGLGSGAIDAGLNGYAAHHLSARSMNWLHACYCFGAMLGPLLMTAVLTSGRHYGTGYVAVGSVMLALAAVFLATRPMWGAADAAAAEVAPVRTLVALRHPTVLLQMVVFFLYTGVEVAFGQWTFTVLTESRGVDPGPAGVAVGAYWGSIGVGRIVLGMVADRIGIDRLLRSCLLAAVAGAVVFALPLPAPVSVAGVVLIGVGLAPVYPCLMTRTPQRLGAALSAHAVGFQVGAAMMGAAAVPGVLGLFAEGVGLEAVPVGVVLGAAVVWLLHELLVRRPEAYGAAAGSGTAGSGAS